MTPQKIEQTIDEIFQVYLDAGEYPSDLATGLLAAGSNISPSAVKQRFVVMYQEYNDTTDSPYDP